MKEDLKCEFCEPNFNDRIRSKLVMIKQTGSFVGYVSKFRDLQRVARLDELTATATS